MRLVVGVIADHGIAVMECRVQSAGVKSIDEKGVEKTPQTGKMAEVIRLQPFFCRINYANNLEIWLSTMAITAIVK